MLLATAAVVAWIAVWILVAVRVLRRDDLGAAGKIMWIIAILVFPIVGLLVYFLWDAARRARRNEGATEGEGFEPSRRLHA